ncbi:MAG: T9SS type A sorting domain-containing protein [Saprospiraceae bacterium]|nr:T9SS type A sorting domain-containing protein [Saprospiraceae bacterium]
MPFKQFKYLLLPVFLLLFSMPGFSEDYEWVGGIGNWSDPNNWSPNTGTPTNGDNVTINNGVVTADVEVNINDLYLGGGTLTTTTANTLYVEGFFSWTDGTINGNGTVEVTFELYVEGGTTKTLESGTLRVTGSLYFTDGNFALGSAATVSVEGGGGFYCNHSNDATIGGDAGATLHFSDASIFEKNSGSITTIACFFSSFSTNPSLLHLNAGTLDFAAQSSSSFSKMDISLGSGTEMRFSDGLHFFNNGNSLGGGGKIIVAGATVVYNYPISIGCNLDFQGGTLASSANVTVAGQFDWSGGFFSSTATWTIPNALYFNESTPKTLQSGTISVTGDCFWNDGDIAIEAGAKLSIQSGAIFHDQHNGDQNLGNGIGGSYELKGQHVKTSGAITYLKTNMSGSVSSILMLNAGTVALPLESAVTMIGNTVLGAGTSVIVQDGGPHNFIGAISSSAGSSQFLVTGGEVVIAGNLTTNLNIEGGNTIVNAAIHPMSMTVTDGTVDGVGNIDVAGNLVWSTGQLFGAGTVKVNGTSTFQAGSRLLYGKSIEMKGNGFWYGGSFEFGLAANLIVGANTTFTINHGGNTIDGEGGVVNNGTVINQSYCNTFAAGIDFTNMGMVKGNGGLNMSMLMNYDMISPGFSPGQLTMQGFDNYTGTCEMELNGTTPGTSYDQIVVNGMGTLSGTIKVKFINGYMPTVGNRFTLIDCPNCSGMFDMVDTSLADLPEDMYWVQSYSDGFAMEVAARLLPVELVDFQVIVKERMPVLFWETASEVDNAGFQVQSSQDGRVWKNLAFIKGNGNATTAHIYSYTDHSAQAGVNYYRLMQTDFSGQTTASPVRSANLEVGKLNLIAFPNPAISGHSMTLSVNQAWETITVMDVYGRLVRRFVSDENAQAAVLLEALENGIYYVSVVSSKSSCVRMVEFN